MAFTIDIQGIDKIRALGARVTEAFRASATLAAARDDISRILVAQNNREFSSQSGPDSEPWAPLSSSYEKRKRKLVGAKPILVRTGAMQRSLQSPLVRLTNFGRDLTISYAGEHSELIGLHSAGAGNLPVRKVGGLGRQAKDEINRVAFQRISAGFSRRLKEGK